MTRRFVALVLLALYASACAGEGSINSYTGPSENTPLRNVSKETLPATHPLMNPAGVSFGSVTVITASIGSNSGPGLYFSYTQDPVPSSNLYPELHGMNGEVMGLGVITPGAIYPLNGMTPAYITVRGPSGSSARFELVQ
jgi:hypothetical protein